MRLIDNAAQVVAPKKVVIQISLEQTPTKIETNHAPPNLLDKVSDQLPSQLVSVGY